MQMKDKNSVIKEGKLDKYGFFIVDEDEKDNES